MCVSVCLCVFAAGHGQVGTAKPHPLCAPPTHLTLSLTPLPDACHGPQPQTVQAGKRSAVTVAATTTIAPFNDPSGNPTNITIVAIGANRGAPPTCPCTAAQRRSGCTCMPDAALVGNGSAVTLLPLLQARDTSKK